MRPAMQICESLNCFCRTLCKFLSRIVILRKKTTVFGLNLYQTHRVNVWHNVCITSFFSVAALTDGVYELHLDLEFQLTLMSVVGNLV
jgi:hypothetical protein